MVKLQKRFAYKYKDKEHYKYLVTIPADTLEQLEWEPNTELVLSVSGKSLVLAPSSDQEISTVKNLKKKRGQR